MKKNFSFKHTFLKRNMILAMTALVLITVTVVGTSVSWIEEVSHVEFSSQHGQETPLHVGSQVLKSDVSIQNDVNNTSIDLSKYFYEGGDMHLSPCFSDGDNFYFPTDTAVGSNAPQFRKGTKDDANVNYLSVTFRVRSVGANTVYWFERSGNTNYVTFKNGESSVANFQKYLRCSITIDGSTNVYAFDDPDTVIKTAGQPDKPFYDKTYKKITFDSSNVPSITEENGRSVDQFTYCQEDFVNNLPTDNSSKANQGSSGSNLNGNTLFTVNAYDEEDKAGTVKTVTLKIWLECPTTASGPSDNPVYTPNSVTDVDIANLNLNLVSSWAKKRRIYVDDRTIDEFDDGFSTQFSGQHTGANWLSNSNGKLYWGDTLSANYTYLNKSTGMDSLGNNKYYMDIPAVYNNVDTALYRCNGAWNSGNTHEGESIKYWDKWTTTFPDTFHSETYTVYSHKYATWQDSSSVHYVKFINSAGLNDREMKSPTAVPHAYLWASATDIVEDGKRIGSVVENKEWPGEELTRQWGTVGNLTNTSSGTDYINNDTVRDRNLYISLHTIWTCFFTSTFDRAVFNDGRGGTSDSKGYQTQDLVLNDGTTNHENDFFDMATLKWYTPDSNGNPTNGPTYTRNYLRSNINQENEAEIWAETNFTQGGLFASDLTDYTEVCRIFAKSAGDYQFQLMTVGQNNELTYYGNNGGDYNWQEWTLTAGANNIQVRNMTQGIHRVYLKWVDGNPKIKIIQNAESS